MVFFMPMGTRETSFFEMRKAGVPPYVLTALTLGKSEVLTLEQRKGIHTVGGRGDPSIPGIVFGSY